MSPVRMGEAGQCLRRVGGARNTVDGGESDMELSRVEVCSARGWLRLRYQSYKQKVRFMDTLGVPLSLYKEFET
ncbi:hypothetical protein BDR05DRAFT_966851 [Suillus weaverae]|nr:hypothetical protein BDR05DRAFT_966851 [Suillus weaverae]